MFFTDVIDINETNLLKEYPEVLHTLLWDKTVGRYLLWGTDDYAGLGEGYQAKDEMLPERITVANEGIIKSRCMKDRETQIRRIRAKGEVFTPAWLCNKMNNAIDEERKKSKDWRDYIRAKRLEITCGEAPFLCSRYDMVTGERIIPIEERIGLLDRKLQLIQKKTRVKDKELWLDLVRQALQSVYGYDWQGDNVVLARENLLMDVIAFYQHKFREDPEPEVVQEWAEIIAWNVWQMDGLKYVIPNSCHKESVSSGLFGDEQSEPALEPCPGCKHSKYNAHNGVYCRIMDWEKGEVFEFKDLVKEGGMMPKKADFKFDVIIGNPPYQEKAPGTSTSDKPIYHYFMQECYKVSDITVLVTPGRFLFNAGATPSAWNEQMLNDEHLKVIYYETVSAKVFNGTDIKGGVVITYHDSNKTYGKIGIFTSFNELNGILSKVASKSGKTLDTIIYTQNKFNLDVLNKNCRGLNRTDKRLESNIFSLPIFTEVSTSKDDIQIIGLCGNEREYRFVNKKFIDMNHGNIDKYKVVLPKSNGSGNIGEVLSTPLIGTPLIGTPLIGYTRTFIGIGAFDKKMDAEAAFKYIKSKFCRVMLGILKVTQDNNPEKWRLVPLQDFTSNSDIDWSKSVAEIDQQLYKKYGLSKEEIEFIESHVKEMV